MVYTYKTSGVCSRSITLTLEDGVIRDVHFEGGCSGNTQGVEHLVRGMKADDVVRLLKGIQCGPRETSCPDQLALAIEEACAATKQSA